MFVAMSQKIQRKISRFVSMEKMTEGIFLPEGSDPPPPRNTAVTCVSADSSDFPVSVEEMPIRGEKRLKKANTHATGDCPKKEPSRRTALFTGNTLFYLSSAGRTLTHTPIIFQEADTIPPFQ